MNADHEEIIHSSIFKELVQRKKRFIIPATVFFMSFYLLLPITITFFPKMMNQRLVHLFTWGWACAFAQFLLIWAIGILYYFKAKRYDRLVEELKKLRNNP